MLAGQVALQTHPVSHRPAAELRAPHEGQERTEEAESGGALGGALQEAQRRHGKQDHAAATQTKRTGENGGVEFGFVDNKFTSNAGN